MRICQKHCLRVVIRRKCYFPQLLPWTYPRKPSCCPHHIYRNLFFWSPATSIRDALENDQLSLQGVADFIGEAGGLVNIRKPYEIEGLVSYYDNLWKNQAGNKNRASYSLQEELPDILEALMECVSQENWKSLSRSAKPWDHLIVPLFALKEEASLSDDVINKIWPIHLRV